MKKISLTIFILFSLIGSSFAKGPTLHWLEGNWEGTGGDVSIHFNWTITLSYKADDKSIKLTYPSHNCGGSLKILTIESGKATCMEDVNYGLGQCVSGLSVTIDQESDGSITVKYYYLGTSTLKSIAKLKRV